MKLGHKFKKGMNRLEKTTDKLVSKVPEKYREQADKRLGLFMIKYIATLLFWDSKVQDYMRDYEQAIENDDTDEAWRIGQEMKQ